MADEKLKARLEVFEQQLSDLVEQSRDDLKVALQIQKSLMPNRLPKVPGLTVNARYIPAGELSAESFDLITTKDQRQLWIISSWTETFGLSSLMMQVLVHLQAEAFVAARAGLSPGDLFNDISLAFLNAKKNARYRLTVSCVEMSSLQMNGVSIGYAPVLKRQSKGLSSESKWEALQSEALLREPHLLAPANSATPVLAENAYHYSLSLNPGHRFFIMGAQWNAAAQDLPQYLNPLKLSQNPDPSGDMVDDMNHLLMAAQEHIKNSQTKSDLSLVAIEVDSKKLHLA